jgi:hypothetical protein
MAEPKPGWQTAGGQPPAVDAFHIERVVDPFTRTTAIGMVRHAGHAFVMEAPAPDTSGHWVSSDWHVLGARYLDALAQALTLTAGADGWVPPRIWAALMAPLSMPVQGGRTATGVGQLHWLPITWGPRAPGALRAGDLLGSCWVDRQEPSAGSTDRSLVLLAGCTDHGLLLGSDMGVRIPMHLRDGLVHVHGVTLAGLGGERALHSAPARADDVPALFKLVNDLRRPIGLALGQGRQAEQGQYLGVWIRGLETVPEAGAPAHRLRVSGFVRRALPPGSGSQSADASKAVAPAPAAAPPQRRARIHDFSVDVDATAAGTPQVVAVRRNEFAGSAAAEVPVSAFLADGASQALPAATTRRGPILDLDIARRRVTQPERVLQALRGSLALPLDGGTGLRQPAATGTADNPDKLLHEVRGPRADGSSLSASTIPISAAAVVQAQATVAAVQTAAAGRHGAAAGLEPDAPVFWTDEQASVEAHVRATELFDRLAAYGIDPHAYFRFARLPLVQRARAALQWVPDGDLPSAEVRPFLGDADLTEAQDVARPSSRPQLLVKYGSADPMHRRLVPVEGADGAWRTRAQYLGVASDPRWAWHEFGHVLNFASTGELEFAFAHSAGDALGAIAADPLSVLAPAGDPEHPLRFLSFPWIEVPGRLHGRRAQDGYCWCGRRNLLRLDFSAPLERHHHGYFEEQMLSSSLFRLYRSLGGDTGGHDATATAAQPDADALARLAASDWCIYLVMRAISLLGPDCIAPARSADQFVSALIDADLGTGSWVAKTRWPLAAGARTVRWQGGKSHKVIRWAFERQGLYATDQPTETADGPGQPPAVDVFIADGRPPGGPDSHPGSYAPVPLRWTAGTEPWHAAPDAVQADGDRLQVQLRNRGSAPATGLRLRAWWAPAGQTLDWSAPQVQYGLPVLPADDRQPVAGLVASPRPATAGDGWLLLALDADADPSNLLQGVPPPADPVALMRLVAADNNLALHRVPAA